MELLHTAAAVILGGLATTLVVCLFVLPVASRVFGLGPVPEPDETLAGIAMASGADAAGGVTVPGTRPPAEAYDAHLARTGGSDVEHALVRDNGAVHRDGSSHGSSATDAGPPADNQRPDADGYGEGS
jgi:hypothetical protein